MSQIILHISDIHAQAHQLLDGAVDSVVTTVQALKPSYIIASGDFGYQGKGTVHGTKFVRQIARKLKISPTRIVCCPGNHEIQQGGVNRFAEYFEAVTDLINDATRARPLPVALYQIDEIEFLICNSAYHLDHQYGLVNLDELKNVLKQQSIRPVRGSRIAIVHHHCIPISNNDQSQIRNAYEFLSLLSEHHYCLLLHGHRHMAVSMQIGRELRIIGTGSVNFVPERNVNNQFSVIDVGNKTIRFRYNLDVATTGGLGTWVPREEPW